MALASTLELPGSPVELASTAPSTTFYWDASPELLSGEALTSPVCTIREYDPRYPTDTKDVTATVLQGTASVVTSGAFAGDVVVVIAAASLTPGYEYRVELSGSGSLGTNPWRYFRIACRI